MEPVGIQISPEQALEHGQNFIGGPWSSLKPEDIELKELSGGYSSRLYICSSRNDSKDKFLIRLLGGKLLDKKQLESLIRLWPIHEALVYYKMGETGLGPKLFGAFEGGRIEEYIPSRTLEAPDLDDPTIRSQLIRKLARYHRLDFPIDRTPVVFLEKRLKDWGEFDSERFKEFCKACNRDSTWFIEFDWKTEYEWLIETLTKIRSRTVYCHRDFNSLNILIRDEPDQVGDKVTIIDYEGGCYGPRGWDIGNHWNMSLFDLKKPGFYSGRSYPDKAMRREYIENYLDQWSSDNADVDPKLDTVDNVQLESELYSLTGLLPSYSKITDNEENRKKFWNEAIGGNMLDMRKRWHDQYFISKAEFISNYPQLN